MRLSAFWKPCASGQRQLAGTAAWRCMGKCCPDERHDRRGHKARWMTTDKTVLRLGAQVAEVEALYVAFLEADNAQAERRMLAQLASAGARLAELADTVAGVRAQARRRVPERPVADRVQRRIARAQRCTDWIISHSASRNL